MRPAALRRNSSSLTLMSTFAAGSYRPEAACAGQPAAAAALIAARNSRRPWFMRTVFATKPRKHERKVFRAFAFSPLKDGDRRTRGDPDVPAVPVQPELVGSRRRRHRYGPR